MANVNINVSLNIHPCKAVYNGGLQTQGLKTSIYGLDKQFRNDWVTTIHHYLESSRSDVSFFK